MLEITPESITPESVVVDVDAAEPEELVLCAGSDTPMDASELDTADNLDVEKVDAEEGEPQVRGPLQTREAYLKKGEDLIRSLL
jgi:hypothetical protein